MINFFFLIYSILKQALKIHIPGVVALAVL